MADRDQWDRRRFLVLAGGTTILAGCAAEPPEEGEPETSSEDDGNEESNDTAEQQEDNPDENETGTDGNESESNEGNGTEPDTEGELGNESEEGNEDEEDTETSENSSTEEKTPTEGSEEETPTQEETANEEETGTPTEEESATEEEENTDGEDTPSEPPLSEITTQVVGPAGEPIEGASVTGEGDPHEADIPLEFSGETDSDGVHESRIYENEYTIEVDHPDYEATTVEHNHDGESELRVELEAAVDTSALTLTVTNSEGEPVEGATITGQGEPQEADIPLEFSGETDSNGEYTDEIYENEYTIEITHSDYGSETLTYTHDGNHEREVTLGSAGTSLTIVAIDSTTGGPIEEARVAVYGDVLASTPSPYEVDSDGSLTVQIEESGEVEIVVTDGFHPTHSAESYNMTVGSEPKTVELEAVEWPDSCTVSAEVVDEEGEPIEGADLTAQSEPDAIREVSSDTAITDANGTATLETMCGDWHIRVGADGYESINETREIDDDSEAEFVLGPELETEMLTFEIVDAETDEPLEGAEVSAYQQSDESEEISGSTAEKGIIHFKQPAATWEVSVDAEGYASESFTVEHDTDEPTETVVELDPEGA